MTMRLSYLLLAKDRPESVRGAISRLQKITRLPREQWEICVSDNTLSNQDLIAISAEFPDARIIHGLRRGCRATFSQAMAGCAGDYIIPIVDDFVPAGTPALASLVKHIHSDRQIGAVTGSLALPDGSLRGPHLATLAKTGITCFRKSALAKTGALPELTAPAMDYFLSFKILAANLRIDRREDVLFESADQTPIEGRDDEFTESESVGSFGAREIADLLGIAHRYLPQKLADIYWRDWEMKYRALAAKADKKKSVNRAIVRAKLHAKFTACHPVSDHVIESVFGLRDHSITIGDWSRRASAWRIVLADFSDNLWAAYNACRSSGLQLRCIADGNPAFANMKYRELPIASCSRAFEGGGIDGVIITSTDPTQIESTFRSVRAFFHGPILRLWQTARAATHAAVAA